jgi:hypothetical protein
VFLPVLAAALMTFTDPGGDARGDGGYIYPQRPAVTERMLDLDTFTAERSEDGMTFTVTLGQAGNPYGAPSGYSAGVIDIFVRGSAGGERRLEGTGLTARSGGWRYHLHVTGFGSTLRAVYGNNLADARPLRDPVLTVSGRTLTIRTAVPAGTYAYWVTSSLYSPLSPDGVLRPTTTRSPLTLQAARENAPSPVDVLAEPGDTLAFTGGTLASVGQARDTYTGALAGLGFLGVAATIAGGVWRRRLQRHL